MIIDPFDGQRDIKARMIYCVGNAQDRIFEDALRGLRALRFAITKDFFISGAIIAVVQSERFALALSSVSKERQREEIEKMFAHDTVRSLRLLHEYPMVERVVFSDGLRLSATMKL